MAYNRQRRSQTAFPAEPQQPSAMTGVDAEEERVYTEADYEVKPTAGMAPRNGEVSDDGGWPDDGGWSDDGGWPDDGGWSDEGDAFVPEGRYFAQAEDFDPFNIPYDAAGEALSPYNSLDDIDDDPLAEELLTEQELAELRRGHWKLLSGLGDLLGVIVGTAAILLLVTLLVSLINWLLADIDQTFTLWQTRI